MSRSVLDASALLAVLFKEPGAENVVGRLPDSMLSTANLAEVMTKATDAGMSLEEARLAVSGFPCQIVSFDEEYAYLSASLRAATKPFGLSLADRACLALGLKTGYPVVTADRKWEECKVGVKVIRIR